MKTYVITIAFLLTGIIGLAQTLNGFKYVLVPEQFEIFDEADKYSTNGLTNFLLNKYGFNSYHTKAELPVDALANSCNLLTASLVNDSGFFKTKIAIQLKDCRGEVVYKSPFGSSREKQYKTAYNQALRQAAAYLEKLNYKYDSSLSKKDLYNVNDEVTEKVILQNEIEALKKEKAKLISKDTKTHIVEEKPVTSSKAVDSNMKTSYTAKLNTKNGLGDFEIFDSKSNKVYTFYATQLKDVFLVKLNNESLSDKSSLAYKKGDFWQIETRNTSEKQVKLIQIKF